MNNQHVTNSLGRIAANSLITKRPKGTKHTKDNKPEIVYAFTATNAQRKQDARIEVIEEFIKTIRSHHKGTRTSTIREFVLEAIHSAIVKQAGEVAARAEVIKELERQNSDRFAHNA